MISGSAPTLARRVLLALFLANTLVWVGVFWIRALSHEANQDQSMLRFTEKAGKHLNRFATEQEASAWGRAWQRVFLVYPYWNGALPTRVEVWSRDGRRIYTDPAHPMPAGLHGKSGALEKIRIDGQSYSLFRQDGARWSLRTAIHVHSIPGAMASYLESPVYRERMLISYLVLMAPLWLILRRGLQPLRAFSAQLARRAPDDLTSPLQGAAQRELAPLAAALSALMSQLRARLEREQAFLQDAAHELRTPLAVIVAQTHVLARTDAGAAHALASQQIELAMARAGHLVRQLHDLACLDDRGKPSCRWLDLTQLLKDELLQIRSAAQLRQIELILDAPPALQQFLPKQTLQLIIGNLLNNAIRYGRPGGSVHVTLTSEARSCLLRVADDGPGIPPAEREQVFERFYRSSGNEVSGSGLGLAIVRQAAQSLQAQLWLEAGLQGKGCGFCLRLPFRAEGRDKDAASSLAKHRPAIRGTSLIASAAAHMACLASRISLAHCRRVLQALVAPSLMWRILAPVIALNLLLLLISLGQGMMQEVRLNLSSRQIQIRDATAILQQCRTQQEALMFVDAFMPSYEWQAGKPNLVELWNKEPRRLFFRQDGVPFAYPPLDGTAGQIRTIEINGDGYNLIRHDGPRWSLRVAIPRYTDTIWELVPWAASNPAFLSMTWISFPLLLLGTWLAVARGLAPLHWLAHELAGRSVADLAPLVFPARYAELQPVVVALNTLLQRLRDKLARERQFIQDMAHKLGTPFDSLVTLVRQLQEAACATEKRAASHAIEAAIGRTSHLIAQLLELARLEGTRQRDDQGHDIAHLVRVEMAALAPLAMARDIELSLAAPASLIWRVERSSFTSLLRNLLENAIRHGRDGGVVEVELVPHAACVALSIADDGPGLPPSLLEPGFGQFSCSGVAGAGLGMAIVRLAARRMRASLAFAQGLHGRGSRITLQIGHGANMLFQTIQQNHHARQ